MISLIPATDEEKRIALLRNALNQLVSLNRALRASGMHGIADKVGQACHSLHDLQAMLEKDQ